MLQAPQLIGRIRLIRPIQTSAPPIAILLTETPQLRLLPGKRERSLQVLLLVIRPGIFGPLLSSREFILVAVGFVRPFVFRRREFFFWFPAGILAEKGYLIVDYELFMKRSTFFPR